AEDHAVRRTDLRARPGAARLGARGDARPARLRHDHGGGEPRDALRPRGGRPRGVPRGGRDRRAGPARAHFRPGRRRAHPRVCQRDRALMHGSMFIDSFFKPEIIARYWPDILRAMVVTIEVAVLVVVTGLALGLLLAVVRSFRVAPINALIVVYVDVFRALPPLVLVLLVYFGLPNVGINLPSGAVLWLVLHPAPGGFAGGVFLAGLPSVPQGRWGGAGCAGLGFGQTLAYVILPQAIRLTVPPLTNRTIAITKNTALGSVIGVPEILNVATTTESFIGNATPLTMGALAYVALFVPVVLFGRWLETRFASTPPPCTSPSPHPSTSLSRLPP